MLDQSAATDQDSYNVTAAFAEANNLTSHRRPGEGDVPADPRWRSPSSGAPLRPAGLQKLRRDRRASRRPVTRTVDATCSRARSTSPTSTAPTRASRPTTS